jgi:hypothetical protein
VRGLAAALLLLAPLAAPGQDLAPEPGRYLPLYPGMYWTGALSQDPRDSSFDAGGNRRGSAAPSSGDTSFPERAFISAFTWHFPMFESQGIPFVSSRMYLARATLRYVDTRTEGALAAFADDASDDASTNADSLKNSGKGVGDLTLEFGSFLYGAPASGWRNGCHGPVTVLLLASMKAPTGVYEHEAPDNAGSNHWTFGGTLASSWQAWNGGFVDAGLGYRAHSINYQPEFGGAAPFRAGAERTLDLGVGQRVARGLFLSAFAADRRGSANQYRNLEYTPGAPAAPAASPGNYSSRNFPTPGTWFDGGTALRAIGVGARYFPGQTWRVSLDWTRPLSGKSGEFDQPFTNRQCTVAGGAGAATCTDAPAGSAHVDGLGEARAYASDRLILGVTHQFGLGDAFSCAGCRQ